MFGFFYCYMLELVQFVMKRTLSSFIDFYLDPWDRQFHEPVGHSPSLPDSGIRVNSLGYAGGSWSSLSLQCLTQSWTVWRFNKWAPCRKTTLWLYSEVSHLPELHLRYSKSILGRTCHRAAEPVRVSPTAPKTRNQRSVNRPVLRWKFLKIFDFKWAAYDQSSCDCSEHGGSKIDRNSCWPRLGTTLRWLLFCTWKNCALAPANNISPADLYTSIHSGLVCV